MIELIGVVVPASNERQLIGACLDALARAGAHLRRHVDGVGVRTIVVLDSCTDGTADVVARYPHVEVVTGRFGAVGPARAAGVAHLLCGTAARPHEVWVANTDADSQVRAEWLTGMVALADDGADVVLGTVLPEPGLPRSTELRWHAEHVLRADHPHVHGANFGIRADAYSALGGWPPIATGEDVVLARRAALAGHLRTVRSSACPVHTSVRPFGRAPFGFSSHLRGLAACATAGSDWAARS